MSAQRCLTAWNEPIGRPNCSRSLAYSVASSVAAQREPELERRGEHDADEADPFRGLGVGDELARGHVTVDDPAAA